MFKNGLGAEVPVVPAVPVVPVVPVVPGGELVC